MTVVIGKKVATPAHQPVTNTLTISSIRIFPGVAAARLFICVFVFIRKTNKKTVENIAVGRAYWCWCDIVRGKKRKKGERRKSVKTVLRYKRVCLSAGMGLWDHWGGKVIAPKRYQ